MYYLILLLLILCTILNFKYLSNSKQTKKNKYIYIVVICILTFVLCFRFGQGTDYLAYFQQYKSIPPKIGYLIQNYRNYHGEIGWLLMIFLSKKIGLNFETFMIIISFSMMMLLNRGIKKYSPLKVCSLLLFFPTFYMTYCFSAIRQGICICVFLGIGLDLLLEKKFFKYIILTIIMALIHRSAIILIVLPCIVNIDLKKYQKIIFTIPIVTYLLLFTGALKIINNLFFGIHSYIKFDISLLGILARIVVFIVISVLHYEVKENDNKLENKIFNIYSFGFYLFIWLSFAATLSQRLTVPLKALEIFLIPLQLDLIIRKNYKNYSIGIKKIKMEINYRIIISICAIVIFFLPIVEFNKNINAYMKQGEYYDKYNSLQYPFIPIWEKNRIHNYVRDIYFSIDD